MTDNKERIRKAMIAARSEIEEAERMEISTQLQEQLYQTDLWKNAETIGVYLSVGKEWDTRDIVERALAQGKNIVVPKTIPDSKELVFYQLEDASQTVAGHFGLEEPDVDKTTPVNKNEIDLLIVPGLVFTRNGYRIGFGGGYYDRFLANFIHPTASLVHTNQLIDTFPIESFDIPVNYLITEKGLIE